MKTRFSSTLITVAMTLTAAAALSVPASAQTGHTANIPFAFQAGSHEYPAGTYLVNRFGNNWSIQFKDQVTGKSFIVPTPIPIGKAASGTRLTFRATSNGYQLAEAWLDGAPGMSARLPKNEEARVVPVDIK